VSEEQKEKDSSLVFPNRSTSALARGAKKSQRYSLPFEIIVVLLRAKCNNITNNNVQNEKTTFRR
jgi:hypothetical protein